MSINAHNIKKAILKPAKKAGILIQEDGQADRALNRGSVFAAKALREGEKVTKQVTTATKSALENLRQKIHTATAPAPAPVKRATAKKK